MKCAKKPLPQKGAYLVVRDRIAEGGFDKAIREIAPSELKETDYAFVNVLHHTFVHRFG